jgi:adenylosuccinate synthase
MTAGVEDGQAAAPRFVVLSGPVGAGKSTLAEALALRYDARRISTHELLQDSAEERDFDMPAERRALQEYGDRLDQETDGRWVADVVADLIAEDDVSPELVIVDSVRRLSQIDALRDVFPARVTHIHVHCPEDVLDQRYQERGNSSGLLELPSYAAVLENDTERDIATLAGDADVSIDTNRCTPEDVHTRAAAALRLLPSRSEALVDVLIGGQYGSEGKGNIAYYLAGDYQVLMRVGGPNAGHTVPTTPPYTHHLLPSGTLANPNATLLIGPGATLEVTQLLMEIAECKVEVGRLFIDAQAMIIEGEDIAAEQGLVAGIGSTGRGGGAAAARRIMGRHGGTPPVRLAGEIPELKPWIRPALEVLDDAYRRGHHVLLEGTQGTSLSLYHGSYPHVTSRDTTTAGCLAEAGIAPRRVRRVVMVVRTYPIRVMSPENATSGPMSQELDWADVGTRSGLDTDQLRRDERTSTTSRRRRVAEFDWQQLRRSAELNGATDIALTFVDYLDERNRQARRYEQLHPDTIQFIEEIERVSGASVTLIGTRFERRSVVDRRDW